MRAGGMPVVEIIVCLLFPSLGTFCPDPPPPQVRNEHVMHDPYIPAEEEVTLAAEPEPFQHGDVPEPWRSLADCESGEWLTATNFVRDSARWHSQASDPELDNEPPWSNGLFYGGIQFTQRSWDWASDVGGHGLEETNPADHHPLTQVAVAKTLLDLQGWSAWPNCSRKIGLR